MEIRDEMGKGGGFCVGWDGMVWLGYLGGSYDVVLFSLGRIGY